MKFALLYCKKHDGEATVNPLLLMPNGNFPAARQHGSTGSTVAPPSKYCTVKRRLPPNSQVPDSEVNPLHSENAVYRVSRVAWKGVLPSGKALSWLLGLLVGCAGLKGATLKIKIP
jgi:hypothetical protein